MCAIDAKNIWELIRDGGTMYQVHYISAFALKNSRDVAHQMILRILFS